MKKVQTRKKDERLAECAVLLAGGRGTRFWPRSRLATPKQLLNITGPRSMLRETVSRLEPLLPLRNIWAVTNKEQAAAVRRELPGVPAANVLSEPVGRNTAAAIGLAAIHLARKHGDALMAVLPSDSYIGDVRGYRRIVRAALELARTPGNMVVLGIPPARPETGYGYIERSGPAGRARGVAAYGVKRFTEKPQLGLAKKYVSSGKYLWNAGMFFWRVSTILGCLERFLPSTYQELMKLKEAMGTPHYSSALEQIYPRLENISIDYAVMEPATARASQQSVFVIPAKVGWSDIGSWAAVHELLAKKPGANVSAGPSLAIDAAGNYFWSPKKFVAAVGVNNVVVVETADAILVCARERSQDIARIVKWLEAQDKMALL
jgi:mannose-1-phosphate guanylyltransferase